MFWLGSQREKKDIGAIINILILDVLSRTPTVYGWTIRSLEERRFLPPSEEYGSTYQKKKKPTDQQLQDISLKVSMILFLFFLGFFRQ